MLLNQDYIENFITTDEGKDVAYRSSHGATRKHLGDGLLIYALIQHMRAKTCVCLGSGGGFIPRLMTQARIDLWEQEIFEGNNNVNYSDIGDTFVVDACNGIGGNVEWADENSFYRTHFCPRFIKATTEEAYYNFFILEDIHPDFIHIDAGHGFENVKQDFELYSNILSEHGVITLHDTDLNYARSIIPDNEHWDSFEGPGLFIKELQKSGAWDIINLCNFGILKDKPSSTGLAIVTRHESSSSLQKKLLV